MPISTTLSSISVAKSSLLIKSSSATKRGIEFDKNGSFIVANSSTDLSFTSIVFTVAQTCLSATLFVVEEGEISFSLCEMGGTSSESVLVLPASLTTLLEVKADGTLTLTNTLIQHIKFSHATLGTVLRLHLDSINTFEGTTEVGEIVSNGIGSHVLIVTSSGLNESSISSLTTKFAPWKPTTTNGVRFTKPEINEFVAIDENEQVDELIYHLNEYDGKTKHVDTDGGSHPNCGLSVLPCSSISNNVDKIEAGETILVYGAVTERTGFIATKNLTVKSSDNTKQVLSIADSASFTTRYSSLTFTDLAFVPLSPSSSQNAESLERAVSLFVVESGSVELKTCSVSSFVIADSPLITHTSGTLTLKSCEISSITRTTGNGTVLSTDMETGKSLLLDDVTFSSMPSSKESALLALSFPPCDEDDSDPLFDFTLTNLVFSSMTGMDSEPPCFISIVGTALASWIEVGDVRFKNSYDNDSNLDSFSSFDKSIELAVSLLFYLRPSEGPVGVSSSGYTMAKCGSNSLWCSTIEQSLTRLTPQNTKKIVVMNEVTLSTSIALPDELTFAGNPNGPSTCVVSAAGSFVSEDIDFTTISKLTFSLPSTQTAEAVIVHSSNTLILSHLDLSSTAESSACFLKVTAGNTEMSDIQIRSELAQNSILFWILEGTVTASQFRVESRITRNGTIIKVEGGSLSLTGMTATSSKPMEGRLFSVHNASFNLSDVKLSKQSFTNALFEFSSFGASTIGDMNVSECSGSTIMTVKDGDELTIRNSVFSSHTTATSFNEADTSDLCGWETSLIEIEGTTTTLSRTDLTHIPQGAISISDAPLTLTACSINNNSPSNLEWPSLRRNIKCSNGTIGMDSMNGGGDGPSSPHLWIWTDECLVTKDDETQHSTLFVPTLVANESTSILDKKLKEYSVKVVGTMMIPCGVKLEVFEQDALSTSNEGPPLSLDISSLKPSKWTETELSFLLTQSSLADLNKKSDLRCRLVYADNQTTDSFSLTGSSKGNMSQGGVITFIVVPIVAVIIVAVLLIIVIAVLCRRRGALLPVAPHKPSAPTPLR
ncbi:hypothetical protein BLNAU_20156 [Blattamonas nauphoetae]|uniref:Uncharacterized protein n=1 Tax=Blattamonas nauphoetae TaxID=2049346 RepID=A0ABQ9X017_9EUKA|nr:hypothetical protein BLNAU_20156 [Blattamonas nauphoetae]